MWIIRPISLCVCALILFTMRGSTQGQESIIVGKVIGEDMSDPPPGWVANVSAMKADRKTIYRRGKSRREKFAIRAEIPVKVYLSFEALHYEPLETEVINTSEPEYFLSPDATLTRIRRDPKELS